jgi:hypothetical protein
MKQTFNTLLKKPDLIKFAIDLSTKFDLPPNPLLSNEEYLSSLLLIDAIDTFLSKAKVTLPSTLNVLDAGAGQWEYALPLYDYLCGKHRLCDVELHGIDIQGKQWQKDIVKKVKDHNIHYHAGDFMQLHERSVYDIFFFIHMFPPYRFKDHSIPFRPYREMLKKAFDLLKPEGLFIAISYGSPSEEYSFFDEVPSEYLLTKGRYAKEEATRIDFLLGKDTFHNNMVLIARKP